MSDGTSRPGGSTKIRGAEMMTAVVVALIVAGIVIAIGMINREQPAITADPENAHSETTPPGTPSPTPTSDPGPIETQDPVAPTDEPVAPEVTEIEISVVPDSYTGRCPVTLDFSAHLTTNTGPFQVQYEWLDVDSNAVADDVVHFGGDGSPQGATVTHAVEVHDDVTEVRRFGVTSPNELVSESAEATVTCLPYAEITKGGDTFSTEPAPCLHLLQFDAAITVPHDMSVTYEWLRSDGAIDGLGPYVVDFNSGGTQTQTVPGKTWQLGATGDFGYRLHILSPYDVTSDPATYSVDCSGPAT